MNWLRWLFDRADEYAAESTWRDFALVKICLCAVGILLGLLVPSRHSPKWPFWPGSPSWPPTSP